VDLNIDTPSALYGIMFRDNYPAWMKDQIKKYLDRGFTFNSTYINNLLQKIPSPDPEL
jgi:hypothetical protein